jgi:hypothetical protein
MPMSRRFVSVSPWATAWCGPGPGSQHRTDAVNSGESAAGGLDDLGHPRGVVGDPGIDGAYFGD